MPNYEHWIEVLLGGLVALGGWLWTVGRKYQRQEDRVRRLEEWQAAHTVEHGTDAARLERKMDDLYEIQNTQNIALARIESNQENQRVAIAEINKDVREIRGARMPGGNRPYDPPLPQ